ncbi:MAG: septum site-determining protein MinC [Halorhodospira halophila]|uniref:septum site-determining protein MinC n=1 Tax=Halorhodospira TaxID=85108 RepID=UPI00191405EB|nr:MULTISPECIES: septum site-determining protein MinC [Halorhodospira]MBK5936488.1 septum site-determining protein MinC [Halorhodospira halophila]MBK5943904.1 septum site-determining protein MinC [Halorhodospira halophila]MCC3751342.1 septum site-determining protein MinC [Halorhodospira halophila]MCG5527981.1 septum site-determining protein MinC [Halorhodospira halophila]MCG5533309.1 septum site-determining protein MinC [Halorhodospira sp. 9621]
MASRPPDASSSEAFELKGRMATLTVVRVLTTDVDALIGQLTAKLEEAPRLLRGAPMLLDLDGVDGGALDLQRLTREMRALGAAPVAVRGNGVDPARLESAGLGVLPAEEERDTGGQAVGRPARREATPAPSATAPAPTRVIETPVRSGQQIYARGGSLVVLGPVGPGAEVLADGDIHIYGALRGRALAGVQGNAGASIFCQGLEAELVSVAGEYQVNERIATDLIGRPARVHLDEHSGLRIEAFGK